MSLVGFEVVAILFLVLASGAFTMAEMAVVSAHKLRLQQQAEEGNRNAKKVLELAGDPNEFLSTVQVGITVLSTLTGAFSGLTLARQLTLFLRGYAAIAPYAEPIAVTFVVLAVSYLTLILGELVPKNLALANPDRLATALAPAMVALSKVAAPAVRLLSWSTERVLHALPEKRTAASPVTEEDIKNLVAEGARHGAVEEAEQEMVEGVFRLGDRTVAELMRPAMEVEWIGDDGGIKEIRQLIATSVHSRFPVAHETLDQIVGVVSVRDLLSQFVQGGALDLKACVRKPLIFPETKPALDALEEFQKAGSRFALVVDEHGATGGIITTTDILQAVVGDLHGAGEPPRPTAVQREDGTWLVDGRLHIDDLKERLGIRELPEEEAGGFSTVGGLVMTVLGRVPSTAERFDVPGWRFEVVDMDGTRVDKVLVSPAPPAPADPA